MTSTTNVFLLPIKMFVTNCECFESEHATLWNCNLLNHNEMNDKHYSVPIIPQLFELAPSYLSFCCWNLIGICGSTRLLELWEGISLITLTHFNWKTEVPDGRIHKRLYMSCINTEAYMRGMHANLKKLALNWDRFDSPAMTTLTRVKAFNSANRSFKLRVRDTDYCQR